MRQTLLFLLQQSFSNIAQYRCMIHMYHTSVLDRAVRIIRRHVQRGDLGNSAALNGYVEQVFRHRYNNITHSDEMLLTLFANWQDCYAQ